MGTTHNNLHHHEDDKMMKVLYEASYSGSVSTLNSLIQKDPLILYKLNSQTILTETPLHISSLLGHLEFTKALLTLKPQLALELDSFRSTSLHMASGEGHVDIVKELLLAYEEACLVLDQEGRIPLHYAVIRGRREVVRELIRAKPECYLSILHKGESILHLCVRYNHLEMLKDLVVEVMKNDSFNFGEFYGWNSILHLAITLKQVETVRYLLSIPKVREAANLKNEMDNNNIIANSSLEIQLMLINYGITKEQREMPSPPPEISNNNNIITEETIRPGKKKKKKKKKSGWRKILKRMGNGLRHKGNWIEEARGTLSLVATVISTITFQAGINPPGGFIQQNVSPTPTSNNGHQDASQYLSGPLGCYIYNSTDEWVCPGLAASAFQSSYNGFYFLPYLICNTISFVASLAITLLLVSGVPLKNKVIMWVLSIGMCVTLTFLALTYLYGIFMIIPDSLLYHSSLPDRVQKVAYWTWIGLLGLVSVFIIMRFGYWLGNMCTKKIKRHMSRNNIIGTSYI
ncbi:ankyrin repeat-containing protein [Senna tora]|uniref:Ankyrin repeat-containing protein n=1 Tax=Senna tora TaxID=362788 RepID=A0A834XFW7_9FABA|nr:ankyrin repeat-containing protein [Senna tora]